VERDFAVKLSPLAVCALLAAPLFAQKLDLKFDALAARASEKAEIDLDANLLHMFQRMTGEPDHLGTLGGVRAVHVRSYTFDKDGAYSQKDLEALRAQVNGQPKWAKVVTQKEGDETTEIWAAADGDKLGGCLIIAAESRELSIVYLEGTLSLAQIKGFMEHDGIHGLLAAR
jgi:hypothetical protein